LIGGPYSIVQVYAWANMIVDYSKESTVKEAITDTFSGEKPCHLCCKIAKAKATEPKETEAPLTAPERPLQHLFPPTIVSLKDPISTTLPSPVFSPPNHLLSLAPSGPPVPPPRC